MSQLEGEEERMSAHNSADTPGNRRLGMLLMATFSVFFSSQSQYFFMYFEEQLPWKILKISKRTIILYFPVRAPNNRWLADTQLLSLFFIILHHVYIILHNEANIDLCC